MKLSNLLKTSLCILVSCCCTSGLNAQDALFKWVKHFPTSAAYSNGTAMVLDTAGNVYTTGSFVGIGDFGSVTVSLNAANGPGYISKLDSNGNFLWAKQIGGDALAMAIDATGNLYIAGSYTGTKTFGTTSLTAVTSTDIFVTKLDNNGDVIWAKSMGGASVEVANAIAVDLSGNVYTTGTFRGTAQVDFDPGPGTAYLTTNSTAAAGNDVFISKLNSSGDFVWVKQIGSLMANVGLGIKTDARGNVYTVGSFNGTPDFDPGTGVVNFTTSGGTDIFILKLNSSGDYLWAKKIGSSGADAANALALDTTGNIYVTGTFSGAAEFNPGGATASFTPVGYVDIFISKYNSAGDYIWTKNMGGAEASTNAYAIDIDAQNNIYTTGSFNKTIDFDPGPDSMKLTCAISGKMDIYISRLDANGNFVWAKQFKGDLFNEYGRAIKIDAKKNVYTTGLHNQNITDFDPGPGVYNLTSSASTAYVHKMYQVCTAANTQVTASACDSYTLNNQKYISSGTYTQSFLRTDGCDSIIHLNLTINTPSTSTITDSGCYEYTLNSQTYITSGTYTQTRTNAGGCDSVITLDLTINNLDTTTTLNGTTITANDSNASYQWIDCNSHTVIQGATARTYTAPANGNYAVLLTAGSCADTSGCVAITGIVNIPEIASGSQIRVYPNPVTNLVHIHSDTHLKDASLIIRNIFGQEVLQQSHINGTSYSTDINHLSSGIYFLELTSGNQVSKFKVVKQ